MTAAAASTGARRAPKAPLLPGVVAAAMLLHGGSAALVNAADAPPLPPAATPEFSAGQRSTSFRVETLDGRNFPWSSIKPVFSGFLRSRTDSGVPVR